MLVSCAVSRGRGDGVVAVYEAGAGGVGPLICRAATHEGGLAAARLCASGAGRRPTAFSRFGPGGTGRARTTRTPPGEAAVACGEDLAVVNVRDGAVALRLGEPGAGRLRCCDFDTSGRLVVPGGASGRPRALPGRASPR